jgi:hypothetical protein
VQKVGDSKLLLGALGYFIVLGVMLSMSGLGGVNVQLPVDPNNQNTGGTSQSFGVAVVECIGNIVTIFLTDMDCNQATTSRTFQHISDVLDFAMGTVFFLFQLLTLQVPGIPTWLNIIIVLPPAAVLSYLGIKFIRGVGG